MSRLVAALVSRPVLDLGGSLADRDRVHDLPPAMPAGGARPRPALHPAGPQVRCQLTLERTAGLHEQGQIDRLVRHPHLRLVGEGPDQPAGDLLR